VRSAPLYIQAIREIFHVDLLTMHLTDGNPADQPAAPEAAAPESPAPATAKRRKPAASAAPTLDDAADQQPGRKTYGIEQIPGSAASQRKKRRPAKQDEEAAVASGAPQLAAVPPVVPAGELRAAGNLRVTVRELLMEALENLPANEEKVMAGVFEMSDDELVV